MLNYVLSVLVALGWFATPKPEYAWAFALVGQYWSRIKPKTFFFQKAQADWNPSGTLPKASAEELVSTGGVVAVTPEEETYNEDNEGGFQLSFGDREGTEVIAEMWLNHKQYVKVLQVLSHHKPFTTFRKAGHVFVIHHGARDGSLPNGVAEYLQSHKGCVVISCFGKQHPFRALHLCPVDAPLWVSIPVEAYFMGNLIAVDHREGGYRFAISVDSKLIQH